MSSPPPLLLHVFPSFTVGGAQIRFAAFANHHGCGFRHAVIAMDGRLECRDRLAPGLDVTFHSVPVVKGDLTANIGVFRGVLRALRPDVLVTSNWGSIEWAMSRATVPGLRHVHTEDGFGPEERIRQLGRRVWTRRIILRRSTVVLPSRTLLTIATRQWRLPARRLRYIPNGIDLRRFAAGPRPDPAVPVIGTVAGLRPEKNVGRLLRAFALVRRTTQAQLVIVGDGEQRNLLVSLANELGVAAYVAFAGELLAPEEAYRGFDVFALSSDTEQMPLSVLEAMAAGLPVAATDVGDVADMVAVANRPLVTPLGQDAEGLAASLQALLADPARRKEVGSENRAKVEADYSQAAMFLAYAELFSHRSS